jgi:HEAT repeat protein
VSDDVERLVGEAVAVWRAATEVAGYEQVTSALVAACELDEDALVKRGLAMLTSTDVAERAVGCDAAGLVAEVRGDWQAAVATSVIDLANRDDDPDVLSSVAGALKRCADVRAVPVLVRLAAHPDADIRFAATSALPFVMDEDTTGLAVDTLLALVRDTEDDIREWALFGVGSMGHVDSNAIREALRAGLEDPCEEVRIEAIHGLARRRDMTVVPLVAALLAEEEPRLLTFAAAEFLGHPDLVAPLSRFDSADAGVRSAMIACDPVLRSAREADCYELVSKLQTEFDRRRSGLSAALACPLLDDHLELVVDNGTDGYFGAFDVLRQGPTIDAAVAHVLRLCGVTSLRQ